MKYVSSHRPYYLVTAADHTWPYLPWPEGDRPPLVVVDGWGTSLEHGDGIDGFRIHAYRVPEVGQRHWLDGVTCPTRETADRLRYEYGLLAFFVYADSPQAVGLVDTTVDSYIAQEAPVANPGDHSPRVGDMASVAASDDAWQVIDLHRTAYGVLQIRNLRTMKTHSVLQDDRGNFRLFPLRQRVWFAPATVGPQVRP